MAEKKEVKRITLGLILSWIFGIFFLILGMAIIGQGSYIIGVLIMLCSAMIIPYFNKIVAEKFHFEISGGIKFALVIVILILTGIAMSKDITKELGSPTKTGVIVKPTEDAQKSSTQPIKTTETKSPQSVPTQQEQPKQKVKSATLNIDRVQIQLANLYPTRVTVTNTGDVAISPKFDMYIYQGNKEVCSGSPTFAFLFESIAPKEKKTDEITLLGCIFKEKGEYTMKIDLLDSDFNKLDSKEKTFTVNDALLSQQKEMEDLLKQIS